MFGAYIHAYKYLILIVISTTDTATEMTSGEENFSSHTVAKQFYSSRTIVFLATRNFFILLIKSYSAKEKNVLSIYNEKIS